MRITLVILFSMLSVLADAQMDRWLEFRASQGFFIPHRETLPQLQQGHSQTLELCYLTQTDGTQSWHQDYRGPQKGIGFFYIDLGNKKELGDFYSLYPFVALPLAGKPSNGLMLRMGVGLAYVTKTWDLQDNLFNTAIGSHVNYGILMALRYQRMMGRFMVSSGLSMSHASNASIRLPNLGVNVANLDLSIAWRMNPEQRPFSRTENYTTSGIEAWSVFTSFGMRQSNSFLNNQHGVQEIRLLWENDFSPKLSYNLGADVIHNRATYQEFDSDTLSGLFYLQTGINIGIKMRFGTASLFLQNGFYLTQGVQDQGGLYHRFGGRKQLNDQWTVELSLKTHYAKADYLAAGIGYTFKQKTKELVHDR